MKDNHLNTLLAELRKQNPTDFQVNKWKRMVQREIHQQKDTKMHLWLRLAAASIIGFLLGALVFSRPHVENPLEQLTQNSGEDATIEYVFTKTE